MSRYELLRPKLPLWVELRTEAQGRVPDPNGAGPHGAEAIGLPTLRFQPLTSILRFEGNSLQDSCPQHSMIRVMRRAWHPPSIWLRLEHCRPFPVAFWAPLSWPRLAAAGGIADTGVLTRRRDSPIEREAGRREADQLVFLCDPRITPALRSSWPGAERTAVPVMARQGRMARRAVLLHLERSSLSERLEKAWRQDGRRGSNRKATQHATL
jgi:hypothetical protein